MSTNLHAKGAGIPLFFTSWTHVSSCNNASTFPSPSPANGQEASSRERKGLSPKVQHGHKLSKFQRKFLCTCSVEVIHWRSFDRFTNLFLDSQEGFWATNGTKLMLVHRAKRADFRSPLWDRRRHGQRRVIVLQIIGPRSHIDSMMWSQFLLDMSDTDNIPRRVALGNCEENMDNISEELRTWDLGAHNCWGNARRAGPIGPISEGSWEIAAVSLWTLWNSTSTRVSSSIVWRKRVSCLTKAFYATTWNASVTGLQVLHSCLGRRNLKNSHLKQLRRTILGPCHSNFNSGVRAFGKTTVAPKTNKTTTA